MISISCLFSIILQGTPKAPRSTSTSFLRKHSRSGSPVRDRQVSVKCVCPPEDKLTVPKAKIEANKVKCQL